MVVTPFTKYAIIGLLISSLSGCFYPPFNNFRDDHARTSEVIGGTLAGAGVGALIGSVAGQTATGAVVGTAVGASASLYRNSRASLIKAMTNDEDMQFIEYGDSITLIIPTDRYYLFNSPHLNDLCYKGLNNIIKLIKLYPDTPVYVAAFTDNIGSKHHKRMLSQARAETMLTFLWAHDINAQRLHAEGYSDKHDVGDNHLIHGSAFNRRIEIQWLKTPSSKPQRPPYLQAKG